MRIAFLSLLWPLLLLASCSFFRCILHACKNEVRISVEGSNVNDGSPLLVDVVSLRGSDSQSEILTKVSAYDWFNPPKRIRAKHLERADKVAQWQLEGGVATLLSGPREYDGEDREVQVGYLVIFADFKNNKSDDPGEASNSKLILPPEFLDKKRVIEIEVYGQSIYVSTGS
ncbi:MAG: hypothetical protein ACE5F1_15915 [Planctomycetota bacterium]